MKKIMFNDRYGLTQAVIEGRKTMAMMLINIKSTSDVQVRIFAGYVQIIGRSGDVCAEKKLSYKVGEVVAVAQRYQDIFDYSNCVNPYAWEDDDKPSGWTNKMLTKAELMPHQIRITGIKCERLQDISEEDCMKEGILGDVEYDKYEVYGLFGNSDDGFDTPREAFASLIDKVSGRGTWDRNPWVVVYEFELVK
ncbi:hypothetical protein [Alistipes communis]|jgi:hypothetical protein|uniref:hypothetical protein n=1 Tax=Alistipes communis TaxID=2585118 RepID=UPI002430145D|nr:hypothetical protein [Alistipes communis]